MLTDLKARKLKAGERPLHVGGVAGLYLRAGSKDGRGRFILRYVSPVTGKRRDMGLGVYPETGLALARQKAFEARALIAEGIDPIDNAKIYQAEVVPKLDRPTFTEAAETVHASLAPGFRNKKHRDQWINTLRTYAYPLIGQVTVDHLHTMEFANVLRPIWLTKPETATRVRQRCERVMTWCLAQGLVASNPVAAVDALLPRQTRKRDRVQHFPAVPWRALPTVWQALFRRPNPSVGLQALMFLILTAARSGEVRSAVWDEFDLENQTWVIPPERTKMGLRHRVPLSRDALRVLQFRAQFEDGSRFVFANRAGRPLSDMTLTKLLRDQKVASDVETRPATAHGFRSSFRDWASEAGYPRELAERALAHAVKSETEAAYHRTDLLEQRRPMMQAWAAHCVSDQ
ncbi:tyrosine-type recombinase/integrase [Roseobacter sp. HKCCD9010]|uniref:tyrosine-type recombinase/integrase n=1 Tax=unclassified Roseobacter TaxID=196798 RepID=UPI00149141AC|nr:MULTISPECIES: site-specific integrase [unclassified Roseobacter]MBF9051752.1 tyrosine-type recombinase/integrase [Rhodobacterales bacterium HKCCD4356]NNV13745.1 tyrosine-type recombinase/integrase [Roseobacter sp. HKCCD7357]NNV17770.1 tyrosine-type recombinase/integrase [Roseobacter sp. HKCCD8768]NNV27377.1 tyrosine-type recombinase/integrase [Roseobacter sp. HKCCD8192]NNV31497.1 tyrosine-type recombinase/integrase [Roseobacter sp. HKCCD9061]